MVGQTLLEQYGQADADRKVAYEAYCAAVSSGDVEEIERTYSIYAVLKARCFYLACKLG